MISDALSVIIIGLMVVLVLYPASQLIRQTWAARQRRLRVAERSPKRPT